MRQLETSNKDWVTADGQVMQLCVIHELDPAFAARSRQAMAVVGGISVCSAHFDAVVSAVTSRTDVTDILRGAKDGHIIAN